VTFLDQLIATQATDTPTAVAVIDDERRLTYVDLLARADRLAAALRVHGVRPDDPVAVMVDRSVDLAVAVLGVLRAGGAYVPIEPETPPARVAAILAGARATVCVVDPGRRAAVAAAGHSALTPDATLDGDVAGGDIGAGDIGAGDVGGGDVGGRHPDQLCAVYFTSGSTGRPKGVACTHRGWVNRMAWMQHRYSLRRGETVLHKTTLTFDDAAVELLWPLMAGGRVAMLAPGAHRDPRAIIAAAAASDSVHLQFVPSMLDLFLTELGGRGVAALPHLRSVLCSGEALRPDLVRRFVERFGDRVSLENTWGATEVSIDSTYHTCRVEDGAAAVGSVCVGTPMTGNHVYVLDPAQRRVPDGDLGELCIGGVGLARGYLGDPRRTAAAFVPDPWRPGARLYRTGDRGLRRPDGGLMFVDRVDHQVKIRGVRIELGEVETTLRGLADIRDAAAIAVDTGTGDKQLAAFVVGTGCTADGIRAGLRDVLPSYAVPTFVTVLDALPLHTNGKIDRTALAALPLAADLDDTAYVAPRTITEEAVADIWAAVLGGPKVSVTQDFFAAGGHSLLAVRLLSRLREAFGLDLPLKLIFEYPTVAAAAERLEELVAADVAATEGVQ
jgi:amino acid adenylation domain-containing protein